MNSSATDRDLTPIIAQFAIDGDLLEVAPYGNGHINDTYASRVRTQAGERRYIHPRINTNVFRMPEELMENVRRVTEHLRGKVAEEGGDPDRNALTLVPTREGSHRLLDDDGNYWRTYYFIEGARSVEVPDADRQVYNAAKAFGDFQRQLADLPAPSLHEVIPNFHHTPTRYAALAAAVEKDELDRAKHVADEIQFVHDRQADAELVAKQLDAGELPMRVTHNDTKLNNVLLDNKDDHAVCVIDLDTVMPGSALYDFGDSVRIGATTGAEDEPDLDKVQLDLSKFEQLAHGYLDSARNFLDPAEVDLLAFSAKLLTFECGTRFLTDYLQGDQYFRTKRPGQNVDRCRTQFKMVRDIEAQMDRMRAIVDTYR